MNIEDIVGKEIVVNCKTPKDAVLFLEKAEQKGYLWINGEKPTEDTSWSFHKNRTCYMIDSSGKITYSGIDYFDADYKIIDSSEFIGNDITNPDSLNLSTEIQEVIFNNPATIVKWKDGTKTIVKCQSGDTYNEETGLVMCIVKKACGNKGNFNKVFDKWIPETHEPKMRIEDIVEEKIAVQCKTKKDAVLFSKMVKSSGYKPLKMRTWGRYKKDTCYTIDAHKEMNYCYKGWFEGQGYTIVDSSEFI